MIVFALIGASGTGKSHLAAFLATQKNVDCIIDDGLLIKGNHVLAGRSAKREVTRMAATRRAIFQDPEQAMQTREALKQEAPGSLLIVAISKKMIYTIVRTLEIPEPVEIIDIKDISTKDNIEKAREIREKENRHVIPLPTFAIKKDFPGFLLDPILSFFGKEHQNTSSPKTVEHSIVRPMYSSFGNFYLSENVIEDIINYLAHKRPQISRIYNIHIKSEPNGMIINLDVALHYGSIIHRELEELQTLIKDKLEYETGFYVLEVNPLAKKIDIRQKT